MGATESAQQDGKPEEDALVQEHNVEVNAEEADENLEVKLLQKNGQISRINGAEDQTEELNGLCEAEALAQASSDLKADGPSVIQEAVEPAVINVNEEQGCTLSEGAPLIEENKAETKSSEPEDDEVGFKKIIKFFELKFTLTKDKGEESQPDDESEREGLVKSDDSKETSPTVTTEHDAEEKKSEEEPVCVDLTPDSAAVEPISQPADEATVGAITDAPAPSEEVKPAEGDQEVQEHTCPEEEEEEDMSPIKRFFTTGIFKKNKKEEPSKDQADGEELQTIEKEGAVKAVEEEAAEPANESKVEDPPAGTSEAKLLGSQEKPKVESSPLKRLFSRLSSRRLKIPETIENTAEEQTKTDTALTEETPISSPEDKSKDESKHESDGEGTSDGEKRRPWSSFKKRVTPKRQRAKRPSESEDEGTEKPSADISASETQEDVKPSEEPEQVEPCPEEPKKKSELSVSWEALICGGSTKKRSRKGSNSEDEVAAEKDSRPEDDQGKTAESPLESSQEGDDEHASSSLEQSGSPAEGDGGSTWKSLKKLVTPKRKLRAGESSEQIPSDGETTKEETSFSVKKLISGRKKRRSDGRQEQSSSDEAGKDVGSEDEDDETPSVVPLSEFDIIEPSMVQTIPKDEESRDITQETDEKLLPAPHDLGTPTVATAPNDFEDLTDYITKHQQLSDIPEESVVSPPGEEAFQDDTLAEDFVEWTSEAFTAAEPQTELSYVTAVSHLSESQNSSGNSTPVASEGDIKDTDIILQEAVETDSILSSNLSVKDNENMEEVAAMSLTPLLLGLSLTEETTILVAHEKFEATYICTGLTTEELDITEEMPPMTVVEAVSEVSETVPTEYVSEEDLAEEPEIAEVKEDEVYEAEVEEIRTEFQEEDHWEAEENKAEAIDVEEEGGEEMGETSYMILSENQQETELVNGLAELVPIHVAITNALQGEAQYLEGQVIAEDTPRPAMEGPMDSAVEEPVCAEPAILAEVTVREKEQSITEIETADADILHVTLAELVQSEASEIVSSVSGIPTDESSEMPEAQIPVVALTVQSTEVQEAVDVIEPVLDSVPEEVSMENAHAVCFADDRGIQVKIEDIELQSSEPVVESELEVASTDEAVIQEETDTLEMAEKEETTWEETEAEPAEEPCTLPAPEIIQHVEVEDLSAIGDESLPPEDVPLPSEKAEEGAVVEEQTATQGAEVTETESDISIATESNVDSADSQIPSPEGIFESVENEGNATSELELGGSADKEVPAVDSEVLTTELSEMEVQAEDIEAEKKKVVEEEVETQEPAPSIPAEPPASESIAEAELLTAVEVQTSSLIEPELDTPVAALETEASEVTALEVEALVITEPEVEIESVTSQEEEPITETAQEAQAPILTPELVVGTAAVTELEAATPVAPTPEVEIPVVTAQVVETTVVSEPELEIPVVMEMEKETPVVSAVEVEAPVVMALELETTVNTKMEVETPYVAALEVEASKESELAIETMQRASLEKETVITDTQEKETAVVATAEVETAVVETSVIHKLEETAEVESPLEEEAAVVTVPKVPAQTIPSEVSTDVATHEVTTEVAAVPEVRAEVPAAPVVSAEVPAVQVVSTEVPPLPVASAEVTAVPVASAEVTAVPVANSEVPAVPMASAEVPAVSVASAEVTAVPMASAEVTAVPVVSVELPAVSVASAEIAAAPEISPNVSAATEITIQVTAAPEVRAEVAAAQVAAPMVIQEVTSAQVVITEMTTAPVASTEVASAPAVIIEVTPAPVANTEVTTAPAANTEVTPAPVVITEVTIAAEVITEVTSAPLVIQEVTTAAAVITEVTSAPVVIREVTPAPVVITQMIHAPVVITEVTTAAAVITEVTSAPVVIQEVTTAAAVITEVTSAPVVIQEVTPAPVVITEVPPVPVVITQMIHAPVVITEVTPAPAVISEVASAPAVISGVAATPAVQATVVAVPEVLTAIVASPEVKTVVANALVVEAPVVVVPEVDTSFEAAPKVDTAVVVSPSVSEVQTAVVTSPKVRAMAVVETLAISKLEPEKTIVDANVLAPVAPAKKPADMGQIPQQVTISKTNTPETEDDVWEDAVDDITPKVEVGGPVAEFSDPIPSKGAGGVAEASKEEVTPKEDPAGLKREEGPAAELQASLEVEFQDAAENSDSTLTGT